MISAFSPARLTLAVVVIATLGASLEQNSNTAQAAQSQAIANCPTNQSIDVTLARGARWEMCWSSDAQRGLVLDQITFTPPGGIRTLILGSAALAQVQNGSDEGGPRRNLLSSTGLPLMPLKPGDCPGGTLRTNGSGIAVVCQAIQERGYGWRGSDQVQGQALVLYGISNSAGDNYIQQWSFSTDGAITPMLGVTGRLDPARTTNATYGWALGNGATRYAPNRFHTAYWRLNFDIGGSSNDVVEQMDYSGTGNVRTQSVSAIVTESARTLSPAGQRFWRIKDTQIKNGNGHAISYQINIPSTPVLRGSDPLTQADVYVTNNRACELLASENPTTGGCANGVSAFLNNETPTDVVIWAGSTLRHVPRDEDEQFIPVRWLGMVLSPRDFMTTSPYQ